MDGKRDTVTPMALRKLTSYPARRLYRPGAFHPPESPGVAGAIDVHCHAYVGQQDALALAKFASRSGMGGLLFKDLAPKIRHQSGEERPALDVALINETLRRWGDEAGIAPVACWAGYGITNDGRPPDPAKLRANLDDGAVAVWLPNFNSCNSLVQVGGRPVWWDAAADPRAHTAPLSWDDAMRVGFYMLDGRGRLKSEYEECVKIVADRGAALFFGHPTHEELWAVAELVDKIGFKKGVIDHPYSPFVDVDVDQMKQLAAIGLAMNFTYDEISPQLGVDPAMVYAAIRAVGVEHCMLSSDAGEPLFPNSVECIRLLRGFMEAFGMTREELDLLCRDNPAKIVAPG